MGKVHTNDTSVWLSSISTTSSNRHKCVWLRTSITQSLTDKLIIWVTHYSLILHSPNPWIPQNWFTQQWNVNLPLNHSQIQHTIIVPPVCTVQLYPVALGRNNSKHQFCCHWNTNSGTNTNGKTQCLKTPCLRNRLELWDFSGGTADDSVLLTYI